MSAPPIATHGGAAGDHIFGRERELAVLDELVDGVLEHGAALLVRGGHRQIHPAGGEQARRGGRHGSAARDRRTVRCATPIRWLHQLVLPVFGEVDLLPTPQRTALLAAFGVTEAAAPDRFLITLGVLR